MSLTLECPNCQDCYSVEDWNKNVEMSILVGRADELIPTDDELNWDEYSRQKGGMVDCPSCGEVCCYEDMSVV
jgi:C4-type Zn-finger protein